MISPANALILDAAIQHVKESRAAAQANAAAAAQAKPAANKPAANKPAAKKPAAKKGPAKKPAAKSSITPYLTATDLMNYGDQTAARENSDTASRYGVANAAAAAIQNVGDIERSRVAGVSNANNDAAARGIYRSGIRAGNVGTANSAAARAQLANAGALALAHQQGVAQQANTASQMTSYQQALVAKAAENGAALPVDPGYKVGANVKGAATKKKAGKR